MWNRERDTAIIAMISQATFDKYTIMNGDGGGYHVTRDTMRDAIIADPNRYLFWRVEVGRDEGHYQSEFVVQLINY